MSIYEMIQDLGRAGNTELVEWYGDYGCYEKRINVSTFTIKKEWQKLMNNRVDKEE